MELPYIPLSQAIGELRTEIIAAAAQASGEALTFELAAIELELQVVVTKSGSLEAGGGLWGVLTLKGAAGLSNAATQKVKLTLQPLLDGHQKVRVSDRLPENLR